MELITQAEEDIATWPGFERWHYFGCADVRCTMIVGYARVSTDSQTLDAQHAALRELVASRCLLKSKVGQRLIASSLQRQSLR